MDKDVQQSIAEHKSNLLDMELAKFASQVLGEAPAGTNWMGM